MNLPSSGQSIPRRRMRLGWWLCKILRGCHQTKNRGKLMVHTICGQTCEQCIVNTRLLFTGAPGDQIAYCLAIAG